MSLRQPDTAKITPQRALNDVTGAYMTFFYLTTFLKDQQLPAAIFSMRLKVQASPEVTPLNPGHYRTAR